MNNSLSVVHPELIVEWSKKNLPLTPDGITFGSNKVVWWKGSCGHEWQTSVKARSKGEKCPICSGARAVAGINDLSTLKPGLASEWSKKNEIKPTEVTVGSHKKVIWKCRLGMNGQHRLRAGVSMVLVVHTVPIIRCLLDLMTLRQWFQKLRMNGQRKMRRSQRKLRHLLIVKHGGSAGIAIMNGIHLFLHAQAEASALVAVAIPL